MLLDQKLTDLRRGLCETYVRSTGANKLRKELLFVVGLYRASIDLDGRTQADLYQAQLVQFERNMIPYAGFSETVTRQRRAPGCGIVVPNVIVLYSFYLLIYVVRTCGLNLCGADLLAQKFLVNDPIQRSFPIGRG